MEEQQSGGLTHKGVDTLVNVGRPLCFCVALEELKSVRV